MRSRRIVVVLAVALAFVLGFGASPANADEFEEHGNATVTPDGDGGVLLEVYEPGQRIVGPGAPAWLLKCQWFTSTRSGVDQLYASHHGSAPHTPEYFRGRGLDPDEPYAVVDCPATADVIAAAPSVALTGYLGAWPIGDPPPQIVIDWLLAATRARVDVPVQIGSSAPTGVDDTSSWITQLTTWLWVDPAVWQPQSYTSEPLFGTTVTVTATPYEVTFEDDDGHFINCGDNVGRVWQPNLASNTTTRCSITPEHTSHTGDRHLSSTIRWRVTYACNQYCGAGGLDDFVITNTRPVVTFEILVVEG